MPNLLTIPTEIRIKILDYVVSDVTVQELTPEAHSNCWVLGRLNNPNLAMGMVCRLLRNESKSQRVPKPILTICGAWCDTHMDYCVLKDVSIVGGLTQFSVLRFEDVSICPPTWSLASWQLSDSNIREWMEKTIRCRVFWRGFDVEVEKAMPKDANQRWASVIVSVVVKPF